MGPLIFSGSVCNPAVSRPTKPIANIRTILPATIPWLNNSISIKSGETFTRNWRMSKKCSIKARISKGIEVRIPIKNPDPSIVYLPSPFARPADKYANAIRGENKNTCPRLRIPATNSRLFSRVINPITDRLNAIKPESKPVLMISLRE